MQVKYTYEEPEVRPIKSAEFRATGGAWMQVTADDDIFDGLRKHKGIQVTLGPMCRIASFNKSDLAEFIEVLQKFHDQLP